MPNHVCMGAVLQCSFGVAPSSLVVLPANKMLTSFVPAANIMDHKPMVNIMPFGACFTPSNPMVAAATAAALGVLTPMPCIPMTMTPWVPGAVTVNIANQPALDNVSTCNCMWGGIVSVVFPGQVTTFIP